MTLQELHEMLKMTGFPVAYSHFNKSKSPPFICHYEDEQENIFADNKIILTKTSVMIELYTSKKNISAEKKLEELLEKNGILWTSTQQYIKEENLFMKEYYIEIVEDKKTWLKN